MARHQQALRRAGQRHLTPLVGREEEIAVLMRRWERARQGAEQGHWLRHAFEFVAAALLDDE